MYFYPRYISKEAVASLASVGLVFYGNELFIPDEEYISQGNNAFVVRGVRLTRHRMSFSPGYVNAPRVFSTLYGDLVPTGVALHQCPICGCWMSEKMTLNEETHHNRLCSPRYEWRLGG